MTNGTKLRLIRYLVSVIISAGIITSCSTTPPEEPVRTISYINEAIFGQSPPLIAADELFLLTEEQKDYFSKYFDHPRRSDNEPYIRVFDFLDDSIYDFNYKASTYTASQTLDLEQGNCMSLAILTTALARFAGVEVGYQLVDATPVFEKKDDVIIRGIHVRTKLFRDPADMANSYSSSRGLIVDYFPGGDRRFLRNISENNFISMYYLNIAADLIDKKEFVNAYWYTLEALNHAPFDAKAINTMAVIHRKMALEEKAEEIYKYGIEISDEKLTLLKNYRILLRSQGRDAEADAIALEIDKLYDPSPYNWISIGDTAYKNGEYSDAAKFYRKSIELAPYLQYGYLGLARVYYAQGKLEKTKNMLISAMENNYNRENHRVYKAKISALSENKELNLDLR